MSARHSRTIDARDAIIGAVLLFVSFVLMVARFSGGLDTLRQGGMYLLSTLEQPLSTIRVYRQALRTNQYLQRQNVLLQDELSRLRSAEQQNQILRELLEFKGESAFDLIPARVVAKELHNINDFITLNIGAADGVREGMPVVHPNGLIGHVTLVNDSYAQVMPYSHALFRASVRVKSSRANGIVRLEPSYSNLLRLEFIPRTIPIQVGQLVETSGNSLQYPLGIPIGTIHSILESDNADTWIVLVQPHVNLNTLAEAFVIPYQADPGLDSLRQNRSRVP